MFDNLRRFFKDIYHTFLARQYINRIKDNNNSEGLSLDLVNEEVIYKILDKELTDDKDLIYSLIIHLKSEELRKNMISKYITTENQPDISILKDLPVTLRIEMLKNKLLMYETSDIKEIIDGLNDSEFILLLENNRAEIESYLKKDNILRNINVSYSNPENYLETIIYERVKKIDDEKLIERLEKSLSIKNITDSLDDKILGVIGSEYEIEKYVAENIDKITNEEKKIEYLKKHSYNTRSFRTIYVTLSENGKKEILSTIFSAERIRKHAEDKERLRKSKTFGIYLKDYIEIGEFNSEIVEDLFYIINDNSERALLLEKLDDNEKAKLLLNKRNFYGYDKNDIDLVFQIKDESILVDTIKSISKIINDDIIEYITAKANEETRFKVVQQEINNEDENTNVKLVLFMLKEIKNKDLLKQILAQDLNKKEYRLDDETNISQMNSIIAEKIVEQDLAEDILNVSNIENFSEENKFLLLLNSNKEIREKILEEHEELKDIINSINENEEVLKKLSEGIINSTGKLIFYKNILSEINIQKEGNRTYSLSQKLAILGQFQEKHASIGETALFDFLEDDIIKEFDGIENIEKLLRYPEIQNKIISMEKDHLGVINYINQYISDKLPNSDYILDEILSEYYTTKSKYIGSSIYSSIKEYISMNEEIPENIENNIFNIITNFNLYSQMFIEIETDREFKVEDIEKIGEIKEKFCDKIISGEVKSPYFTVIDAYLMRFYNLNREEAKKKVTEYITFIEELDNTEENISLKKYIYSLHNVLNSNPEILSIAYNLSKEKDGIEEINRLEIETIETSIKQKIAEELKKSLYKPEDEKIDALSVKLEDGKEVLVDVYEAKEDFNMLVTVLDAYGGGDGVYEDYEEQWNTNQYAQNQRICTTYIGNDSLKTVKRNNCIIFGFTEFDNDAIVKMAPYDIVSVNDKFVTDSYRDAICMGPKQLKNNTRRYSEIDIERTGKDGKKMQPSYVVCFADSIDEIGEEVKKAAAQFGIPIVLINREKCAEYETKKIENRMKQFLEDKDISHIDKIVEEFCNNKFTSDTTLRDLKEAQEQETDKSLVHIDKKYFSDEKFVNLLQKMIDVAKQEEEAGNIEKSKEILKAIKDALNKENEKHFLWQEKFGSSIRYSPLYEDVYEEIWKQIDSPDERLMQTESELKQKISYITKIDGKNNSVELGKRNENFRDDSYDLEEVQDKISELSIEDINMICDTSYNDSTIANLYTILIGRNCGLEEKQIKYIIESNKRGKYEDKFEGFTDEEIKLITKLNSLKYETPHEIDLIINEIDKPLETRLLENESIANEIWDECLRRGVFNKEETEDKKYEKIDIEYEEFDDEYEEEIDFENLSLEEKISFMKNKHLFEMDKIVRELGDRFYYENNEESEVLSDIRSSLYAQTKYKELIKYLQNLPEEKRNEFIQMVKVFKDANSLNFLVDSKGKSSETKMLTEEGEKFLPSAFQIQEAFANLRLCEIIKKEGLDKKTNEILEELAKRNNGKSPVEYAYELDRSIEKYDIEQLEEQNNAR